MDKKINYDHVILFLAKHFSFLSPSQTFFAKLKNKHLPNAFLLFKNL